MKDQYKKKKQLIEELEALRRQVVKLRREEAKRKRAEEALRESEEKFATAFRNSPDSITLIGLSDERVVEVNDGFCHATGYRREEILGHTSLELNLWSDLSERARFVSMLRDQKRVIGFEASFRIKSGEIRVGLAAGEVVQIGDQPFALITIRDITDNKRAEEALKKEKDRAQRYLDIAGVILVAINSDQKVVLINRKGCEILGYKEDEMIGKNWFDHFILERDRISVKGVFAKLVAAEIEPVEYFENSVLTKSGMEKIIAWHNTIIRDQNGRITGTLSSGEDITERNRSEKALRESEKRYRTLAEAAQDMIFIVDREGYVKYVNSFAAKQFRNRPEEIIGKSIQDLFPSDISDRQRDNLQTVFETLKPIYLENMTTFLDRDVWLSTWLAPLVNEAGEAYSVLGISRDITKHKQAEEALRKSEEVFRELYDNAPVGYFEYDAQGRILSVNRTELEMLGYSLEEMRGQPVWKFVVEEDIAHHQILSKLAGTMPPARDLERTYRRKDGTTFPAIIEDRLLRDEKGSIKGLRATIQDITERKQTEEALRSSEEKYRTILENIEDGYYEVDIAGNLTFFNDSFCRIYGYPREELMGMNDRQYTDQENAKELFQAFNKVYRTGEPTKGFDWEIIRKDGTKRCIEASVSLMKDSSGNRIGFRGLVRDVTERRQIEQEKANLQEQLRQSQKIEAIGRLAGGIAHDFNNLLTVIKGYSQLSLVETKDDSPLKENLEEIKKAAEKAADLTRQLLAFSRRQILEMKVLDLNSLFMDLDKMLHRLIGEDIELITLLADDLGRVKTDPGWVEQIIMNLGVNARDAMPNGGKLTIETANAELDEAYARGHIAVKPGRYVMFSVSDTGVGMTPEVRQQVFEPFFTTKEKGKGTGLGLSTVYGIVKQSGGNIWVYSEPGQGTTIKIYLPRVDEPLEEFKERVVREELPQGKETVLVVEDEEAVRQLAVRILKRQGYTVLDVPDGDSALVICEERKEPIHLILTDVIMPGMSGRQLVDRCSKARQDFKVLYMSGYTDNAIVQHGVLAEGVNYIQKPFTVDALARKVREVLDN